MPAIPGLVICHLCGRSGPGVDELIALPDELEGLLTARAPGWALDVEGSNGKPA
jgi:hypothetical protein